MDLSDLKGMPKTWRKLLVWGALLALIAAALVSLLACGSSPSMNADTPIAIENRKHGDSDWVLTNPSLQHEIEGYASATSVNRGETIDFFVSTMDPTFTLEVFRMGWYWGAGARKLLNAVLLPGLQQPIPGPDPITGLIECQWQKSYSLTIPYDAKDPTYWASGFYLAKLTSSLSGKQSYIIFVVRDDARFSKYLFQASFTTFEAYNNWGGKSLYNNGVGGRAVKVSFNRPFAPGLQAIAASGVGAGEFLTNYAPVTESYPGGWQYNMVRFLEQNGYDVTYSSDLDLHERPDLLHNHNAFLVVGHDEYWSWQMRTNTISALNAGVNMAFFAANVSYWQIRMEPSLITGQVDRTEVCYKDSNDPVKGELETIMWRSLGLPEDEFIGVMYLTDEVKGDIQVQDTTDWVFAGTGLHDGDKLKGLLGYEVDTVSTGSPSDVVVLASSPFESGKVLDHSQVVRYTAASGATVFATGSMDWNWGLDDYNVPAIRPSVLSAPAQKITNNVLVRLGSAPKEP